MASIFARFFGRTVSEAAGFAAGVAVAPALHPAVRSLVNETWALDPSMPVEAALAAAIVAEDVEKIDWGRTEANHQGINDDNFDAMWGEALNAPGLPQLFEAWRRDLIDDAAFEHGLRKAKLEQRWDAPLKQLKQRLLSLSDLANARQQGFVDVDRQHRESDLQGLDNERADILFELSGLPLGVETMQQALNRNLVTRAEFDQAIREGHTKTKYTDLAAALRQPVLSAETYRTLHLKGWITEDAMNAGGALHGYTPEQMHLLYLEAGRPAAPGQMWTMLARGVNGPDGTPMDKAQFLKGIRESDIRPEWGEPLYEIRYTYPPLFQVNRLVQAKAATPAMGVDAMRKNRLAPEWVDALNKYWNQGAVGTVDPHVGRAQTQLWSATHRSYLAGEADETIVREKLTALGIDPAVQDTIVGLWNEERDLIRKQLSQAQVKKAYVHAVQNPTTGVAWTRDDAVARLMGMGMSLADAVTYLEE